VGKKTCWGDQLASEKGGKQEEKGNMVIFRTFVKGKVKKKGGKVAVCWWEEGGGEEREKRAQGRDVVWNRGVREEFCE